MVILRGTVDHSFPQLFSTIGQAVAATTLIVSVGKIFTQYYFIFVMAAILLVIGTFSYIDVILKSPQAKRSSLQNYMYSVYERYTGKEVESVLYSLTEQQAKMLTTGTPKNLSGIQLHAIKSTRFGGSNTNLAETPKLKRKQKRP